MAQKMVQKGERTITIITNFLIVLYVVIFVYHFLLFSAIHAGALTVFPVVLLILLLVDLYYVNQIKEWARRLLIALMLLMSVYFAYLFNIFPSDVFSGVTHPGYIIMNMIVILFFQQKKIKFRFQPDWSALRKSILVVDDDEGLQKTIQRILLPRGYSVLTATTGERGLQVATYQQPDLILLDVILPGIKGREVCSLLKEDDRTKNIPVVFLTAKDSLDDVNAEMAAGASSHLTKPVNAKLLVTEIKKLLKQ